MASRSDKVYEIICIENKSVYYSCRALPEANRVFDLLRIVCNDRNFVLNVVLRKA